MKLNAELRLNSLVNRVEKAGKEDGPPAFTLKLSGEISLEQAAELFSTEVAYRVLLGGLFRPDGELITHEGGTMALQSAGVGVTAEVKTMFGTEMTFERCDFDSITLLPKPGKKVDFTGSLHVSNPLDDQMVALIRAQHQGISLQVAGAMSMAEQQAKEKQGGLELKPKKGAKTKAAESAEA